MNEFKLDLRPVYIRRLRHLADILLRMPEQVDFNLGGWGFAGLDDKGDFIKDPELLEEGCGTTCCAAGWAALDPEFQAEGFMPIHKLENPLHTSHSLTPVYIFDLSDLVDELARSGLEAWESEQAYSLNPGYKPTGVMLRDFRACQLFFGLTDRDTSSLFQEEYYISGEKTTSAQVAERILRFLETGVMERDETHGWDYDRLFDDDEDSYD